MAPVASWQASSAEARGGRTTSLSGNHIDQQTVEGLLRRLISRVEESERRYGEALEELHARLDQLSQTTSAASTTGASEEAETLDRLRGQLSSLARRLDQHQDTEPGFDDLAKLSRAWSEARDMSAGLADEPCLFATPLSPASAPFAETAFGFAMPAAKQSYSKQSFELPPSGKEHVDLDKRLIDMAHRLERSIGEAMPAAAIETLNARMEEIAAKFEAALAQSPKLENLQQLERHITDMGQQLGRVEQQIARIGIIEGQLHRLIERLDEAPAQMEKAVSKAANEAVRLVSETGLGKPSAAERLDSIHRDIVAMNEVNRATDDRMVDTLAAVHESLKDLVQKVESGRETPLVRRRDEKLAEPPSGERERTSLASAKSRFQAAPSSAELPVEKAPTRDDAEAGRSGDRPLRNRFRANIADVRETEPARAFGRAKRDALAEAVDLDEGEASRSGPRFVRHARVESREDLVAAARRAAQAAAARAEERGALRQREPRVTDKPSAPVGMDLPERRKRSLLMLVAILLLLLSAALLYSRLQWKPELETSPLATEQSPPPPAAEAMPPLEAVPSPDEAPALESAPAAPPEAVPAPPAMPEAPHAITPSVGFWAAELPTPVSVSESSSTDAQAEATALEAAILAEPEGWKVTTARP